MSRIENNPLRAALAAGRVTVGAFQVLTDPASTELLLNAGLDWVLIDGEHRPMNPETVEQLVRTAHYCGADKSAMVRVPQLSRSHLQHALESGADAVLVPLVNSAEEAREAGALCRYPPAGSRGLNFVTHASGWGVPDPAAYAKAANASAVVAVQIETRGALDAVEGIAAAEGVDMLYVGPTDLSHGLGITAQFDHPDLRAAMERVFTVAKKAGKWLGVLAPNPAFAKWCVERGVTFLTVKSDARMLTASVQSELKNHMFK